MNASRVPTVLTGTLNRACHTNERGKFCFEYLSCAPSEEGGTDYTTVFLSIDANDDTKRAFASLEQNQTPFGQFTGEFIGEAISRTFRVDDFVATPQPEA